jgi:hypothetical protein
LNRLKCFIIKFTGIASFAQERIFLDEQVRFSSNVAIYNELSVLRVVQGSLSVHHLLQTLQYVLQKHTILRTSLIFNNTDSTLQQCITDNHRTFTLASEQTFTNETELQDILYQTIIDPNLFDLSDARVFHCRILRQQKFQDKNSDNDLIMNSDVLIIGFHHVAFDRSSGQIFFNDLCNVYNSKITTTFADEDLLQYIDYSLHERIMDMTSSREFWRLQLERYSMERRLLLPVDRHDSFNQKRSGLASVAHISFDKDISASFLNYAIFHQITPFQLGLATFYALLFKLTHGQNDLCISCLNANRYRTELQNIMGMFVTTVPHRIQHDSHWSFDELVKHVQKKCLSILEYSHYPLQHILADSHLNQSNVSFLETAFDFITVSLNINQLSFDGVSLEPVLLAQTTVVAKFDFMLTFIYNPKLDDNRLSFNLAFSHDLYEEATVAKIAQKFQHLFEQLFRTESSTISMNEPIKPINKLSIVLPEESAEIQRVIFYRRENGLNEGMYITIYFSVLIYI